MLVETKDAAHNDHPCDGSCPPPAERVRLGAALLWDQRVNPPWWRARTPIGEFVRDEGTAGCLAAWGSDDGTFYARLQRAEHGSHAYLVLWRGDRLLGTYDDRGWHTARERGRAPFPRDGRTLRLPLVA